MSVTLAKVRTEMYNGVLSGRYLRLTHQPDAISARNLKGLVLVMRPHAREPYQAVCPLNRDDQGYTPNRAINAAAFDSTSTATKFLRAYDRLARSAWWLDRRAIRFQPIRRRSDCRSTSVHHPSSCYRCCPVHPQEKVTRTQFLNCWRTASRVASLYFSLLPRQ